MKKCFILPSLGKSGGVDIVFKIAETLIKNGDEVDIIYPSILPNIKRWRFKFKLETLKYFAWIPLNFINYNQKYYKNKYPSVNIKKIKSLKSIPSGYDLYVATWWETAEYLNRADYKNNIYFIQGFETWNGCVDEVLQTYKYNFKFITVTKYLKDKIFEINNINSEILYNEGDLDHFSRNKKEKEYKSIGLIYRDNKVKNVSTFIEYIEKYAQGNINLYCLGKDVPKVIADKFTKVFDGNEKQEINNFYNKIGLLVVPSTDEGFSLPVIEAMRCGTLVAIKNMGIAYELIENNKNSFFLNGHSAEDINEVISRYLNINLDEEKKMCDKAEETIKNKYEKMIRDNDKKILELFK